MFSPSKPSNLQEVLWCKMYLLHNRCFGDLCRPNIFTLIIYLPNDVAPMVVTKKLEMIYIDDLPSSSSSASSNQGRQLHIWSILLQITSLLVIHLQLKWHRAYIFHRCATTNWNTNISSWCSYSTCHGDSHSCHHCGSSDRSFYCKEQTLPTLHSGTCYVSCAGVSVAMITSNNT